MGRPFDTLGIIRGRPWEVLAHPHVEAGPGGGGNPSPNSLWLLSCAKFLSFLLLLLVPLLFLFSCSCYSSCPSSCFLITPVSLPPYTPTCHDDDHHHHHHRCQVTADRKTKNTKSALIHSESVAYFFATGS